MNVQKFTIAHCLLDSHNFKKSSNIYFSNVLKISYNFTKISNSGKGTGYWKGYHVGQRLVNS